jgi:hypothetical protein
MPRYSGRVKMATRVGTTGPDGVPPWSLEEVLIDSIKAGSQRKAEQFIESVAKRHVGYRFPVEEERAYIPEPVVVEVVRLNKDGDPVKKTFNTRNTTCTIKPLVNSDITINSTSKSQQLADKAATNVVPLTSGGGKSNGTVKKYSPPKQYPLADPLTNDILEVVMEKKDAK